MLLMKINKQLSCNNKKKLAQVPCLGRGWEEGGCRRPGEGAGAGAEEGGGSGEPPQSPSPGRGAAWGAAWGAWRRESRAQDQHWALLPLVSREGVAGT